MNNTLHTFKIFHEVNLYPTCGQSAQDQQACLLCGPFKYKTSIRSTSQHQSFYESFYSVAGRAARATFDVLAASGVNAQLDNSKLYVTCYRHFVHTHTHTHIPGESDRTYKPPDLSSPQNRNTEWNDYATSWGCLNLVTSCVLSDRIAIRS